eukprot:6294239-Karenia_brevis.AAC.1
MQFPDLTCHSAGVFDVMEMDAPADGQNDPWLLSLGLRLPSAFSSFLSPDPCFYDSEACAAVRDLNIRQ